MIRTLQKSININWQQFKCGCRRVKVINNERNHNKKRADFTSRLCDTLWLNNSNEASTMNLTMM